jgi:hypothetical protein
VATARHWLVLTQMQTQMGRSAQLVSSLLLARAALAAGTAVCLLLVQLQRMRLL